MLSEEVFASVHNRALGSVRGSAAVPGDAAAHRRCDFLGETPSLLEVVVGEAKKRLSIPVSTTSDVSVSARCSALPMDGSSRVRSPSGRRPFAIWPKTLSTRVTAAGTAGGALGNIGDVRYHPHPFGAHRGRADMSAHASRKQLGMDGPVSQ